MVKAQKGVLITCDPAAKQIIINMHENERPIIIQDLDDYHLLVRADAVEGLEARLEAELEKNTYTLE